MLRTSKYFATAATFLAYIALGLLIASLGATFLQLQLQTSSTASQLTFVFTLRSFGYYWPYLQLPSQQHSYPLQKLWRCCAFCVVRKELQWERWIRLPM
jgi:hypothetical protein